MLYAILRDDSEDVVGAWTQQQDEAAMARLAVVQEKLAREQRLGPVARLMPTTTASTLRKGEDTAVIDGPFAETKEQLLGFVIVESKDLDDELEAARELAAASSTNGRDELRPISYFQATPRTPLHDRALVHGGRAQVRPPARDGRPLLRYFRALEPAEDAFQEACLGALKRWPEQGPPRDPAAWLILVGRNAGIDQTRRQKRLTELPNEAELSDDGDAEGALAERLDEAHSRDDILRLLFVCCDPELQAVQHTALALRIICGLNVKQIARAFLVSEAAMEQRITRAKARPHRGVRGALLLELGRHDAARAAFHRAIPLAHTTAEASHIRRQLDALESAFRDQAHRDPGPA